MKKGIFVTVLLCMMNFSVMAESMVGVHESVTASDLFKNLAPDKMGKTRNFIPTEVLVEKPLKYSFMILFETNSATLTAKALRDLDEVGRFMKMDKVTDLKFEIEGHTDPRGGFVLNRDLSLARAEAVINYLVLNHNVDRGRLVAVGKGFSEMINRENTIAPENRRVTIVRTVE
ncbi:MAG: OmpA family protein [Nitrosomonas sp.]|nr:OmpA family protein [Nitrosomonas sp.]